MPRPEPVHCDDAKEKAPNQSGLFRILEAEAGIEPAYTALQAAA